MLFLAQTDGGNDITNWMALRKFGFTGDGGFGSVFVDDLEQNGGQNVDLGEISILEGSNKIKKRKNKIKNAQITVFGIFCLDTVQQPVMNYSGHYLGSDVPALARHGIPGTE